MKRGNEILHTVPTQASNNESRPTKQHWWHIDKNFQDICMRTYNVGEAYHASFQKYNGCYLATNVLFARLKTL